jgi:alkanesulfonate monooxygenase SsuD/methylene tetrahydromethanopterin reductase-like flavin-dependent oxidoreductase (luciferase family)
VALAIIGGNPDRFAFFADLHRKTLLESGHDPALAPLAVHAHGYIADTTEQAADEYYNAYALAMTQLGRERGWGPMNRAQFEMMRGPGGSLVLGDVETVAKKIIRMREVLGIDRFMLHISVGTLPHDQVLHSIELLGTEVAARVESA